MVVFERIEFTIKIILYGSDDLRQLMGSCFKRVKNVGPLQAPDFKAAWRRFDLLNYARNELLKSSLATRLDLKNLYITKIGHPYLLRTFPKLCRIQANQCVRREPITH
jgi:hypothetical protein